VAGFHPFRNIKTRAHGILRVREATLTKKICILTVDLPVSYRGYREIACNHSDAEVFVTLQAR
jgi:hypothetical protein